MTSRLELQTLLEELLGSRNVYFQPPASLKMKYDAIVYSREDIENDHANNTVYRQEQAYNVIAIYEDPDSDLPIKLSRLPRCRFVRHYTSDNLNHDAFTLYY